MTTYVAYGFRRDDHASKVSMLVDRDDRERASKSIASIAEAIAGNSYCFATSMNVDGRCRTASRTSSLPVMRSCTPRRPSLISGRGNAARHAAARKRPAGGEDQSRQRPKLTKVETRRQRRVAPSRGA